MKCTTIQRVGIYALLLAALSGGWLAIANSPHHRRFRKHLDHIDCLGIDIHLDANSISIVRMDQNLNLSKCEVRTSYKDGVRRIVRGCSFSPVPVLIAIHLSRRISPIGFRFITHEEFVVLRLGHMIVALLCSLPFWCILAPIRKHYLKRWRVSHNSCGTCGYNLTGNVSGVCPECGGGVDTKTYKSAI